MDLASAFAARYGLLHVKTLVAALISLTHTFAVCPLHHELLAWMTSFFQSVNGIKAWLWVFFSWFVSLSSMLFFNSFLSWRFFFLNMNEGYLVPCLIYHILWL